MALQDVRFLLLGNGGYGHRMGCGTRIGELGLPDLVNIQKALESGPCMDDLPTKMVFFHSCVKLPEGIDFGQ